MPTSPLNQSRRNLYIRLLKGEAPWVKDEESGKWYHSSSLDPSKNAKDYLKQFSPDDQKEIIKDTAIVSAPRCQGRITKQITRLLEIMDEREVQDFLQIVEDMRGK